MRQVDVTASNSRADGCSRALGDLQQHPPTIIRQGALGEALLYYRSIDARLQGRQ